MEILTFRQQHGGWAGGGIHPICVVECILILQLFLFSLSFNSSLPPPTTSTLTSGIGSLAPIPGGGGGGRWVQRNKEILDQLWVSN